MVEPETFTFLTELAQNNKKVWMDANREDRDDAMRNFTGIATTLHDYADRYDPFVADAAFKAKQSYTKFYKDPRARSTPGVFRTGIDVFANAGDPAEDVGYYLHIEPGNCYAGAGLFQPSKGALARMHRRIDDDIKDLTAILADAEFKAMFRGGLVTLTAVNFVPDGYSFKGPAAPFLKMVGLGCRHDLPDAALLDDDVMDDLIEVFRAASPIVRFFD